MAARKSLVYPVSDGETPSEAVVLAVAKHRDTCATDLAGDLFDVVDPDALDKLAESSPVSVEFQFLDCRVRVHGGAKVEVRPA